MKSIHVQLDETQYELVRGTAYVEKKSMSEIVREALKEYMLKKKQDKKFNKILKAALTAYEPALKELAKY